MQKWKRSQNMYAFFARFGTDLHAQSGISNKSFWVGAQEEVCQESSALLVGYAPWPQREKSLHIPASLCLSLSLAHKARKDAVQTSRVATGEQKRQPRKSQQVTTLNSKCATWDLKIKHTHTNKDLKKIASCASRNRKFPSTWPCCHNFV